MKLSSTWRGRVLAVRAEDLSGLLDDHWIEMVVNGTRTDVEHARLRDEYLYVMGTMPDCGLSISPGCRR